jgi:hypothetical protein
MIVSRNYQSGKEHRCIFKYREKQGREEKRLRVGSQLLEEYACTRLCWTDSEQE